MVQSPREVKVGFRRLGTDIVKVWEPRSGFDPGAQLRRREVLGDHYLRKEEIQGGDACNGPDCHIGGGFGGFADHAGCPVENLVGYDCPGSIAWANERVIPDLGCVEKDSSNETVVYYFE